MPQVLPIGYVHDLQFLYASASTVQIASGRCRDSTNASDIINGGTLTADITASGANGLDAGAEAASTWYAVHIIDGPAVAVASLLSLSPTAPTLPAGYTVFRRIGWVRNDGSQNFRPFTCEGRDRVRRYEYNASTRAALSAVTGSVQNTFTTLSLAVFIPTTARRGFLELECDSLASDNYAEVQTNGSGLASGTAPERVQAPDAGVWTGHVRVTTNATQQIQYRTSSVSTSVTIIVYAWEEDI